MKITADTNILIRAVQQDDPDQFKTAIALLERAEIVAVPIPALCGFVWVLRQGYRRSRAEVAAAIRHLMSSAKMEMDRPAVEAGLAALGAGADFADGCVAREGREMGGIIFASFDRRAVRAVRAGARRLCC